MADREIGRHSEVTRRIEITGIVQGVGFRPFVYRLANQCGLTGYVKNISGSVEIMVTGNASTVDAFVNDIETHPPKHAWIENIKIANAPYLPASSFTVCSSDDGIAAHRFFSPDLAMCKDCSSEIFNKEDRRYGHFFNNCISCGPRFSVLTAFPYDRKNTSMDKFKLCSQCGAEYENPLDRRFHGETTACNCCGPTLFYQNKSGQLVGEAAFDKSVEDLKNGEIIAIKGIGGYHFACLPSDNAALKKLRLEKGRDFKPFAVMFKNIDEIQNICTLTEADIELLTSPARPIVLLPVKSYCCFGEELIFDSLRCGCFLPYTPLQEMIMKKIPSLVMTSANISSSPIIKDDIEMQSKWANVLYSDREIVRSVEDSVVQTVWNKKPQLIRRARGYVPLSLAIENHSGKNILAMGSDLKATFSISSGRFTTISQFFGDLENVEVINQYKAGLEDFLKLFDVKPELVVCDRHPRYFSRTIAKQIAETHNAPLIEVAHHHAHIASVMAEKQLAGKVIGIAFDGSGYGDDGNIWGGEFLICENADCSRVAHLEYTPLLGGDTAAKDALATAACLLYENNLPFSHHAKDIITAALLHKTNTFLSSSIGRLFDAVSAIVGLCHKNSYEGQCATALQYCAEKALKSGVEPVFMSFPKNESNNMIILKQNEIIEKAFLCGQNCNIEGFALGFHVGLANMVLDVCSSLQKKHNTSQVALSGGVFQNSLLLQLCAERLSCNGFSVYFNNEVPANDSGLALGQGYIAGMLHND